MSKVSKWVVGVAVVVAVTFGDRSLMKPKSQFPFITEVVRHGGIRQTISVTGETPPSNLVLVGTGASGQIKKPYVKPGQQMKKGDLIAEIDSTNQLNTLSTEKSKPEIYQAKLASTGIALSSAEKKYKRELASRRKQATSKEDLEPTQNSLVAAKANVAELKVSIRRSKISINTTESKLGHTRITATIDGTAVAIPAEEGQPVNAAQSTPTIIQLASLETMLNKMQITEGDVMKVKAGQDISLTVLSEPDTPIKAKLDSVDPGLTTMSLGSYTSNTNMTSNAVYHYTCALMPSFDGEFSIGVTTQNTTETSGVKNVLLIPASTVKKHDGKSYVNILGADNKAVEHEVTIGLKDSMNTEIKSDLKEGERVAASEVDTDEKSKSNERVMMGGGPLR